MPASERKTVGPALTGRQQRFVREYLVDRNGTAAAKRAGYKGRRGVSLAVTASRLLKKPAVAQLVAEGEAKLAERTGVSAERVIAELAHVGFSDIGKAFGADGKMLALHDMPPEARAALAGVETEELFEGKGEERTQVGLLRKLRLWDKVKALELLGKHLGIFKEKVEHTGAEGAPLQIVVQTYREQK